MSKKYTEIAIIYDFDGTLAKGNIQDNSFIPELGIKKEDFWAEVKELAAENEMDEILSYMYLLVHKAKEKGIQIFKKDLRKHGKNACYFNGVEDYFRRINKYAQTKSVKILHYIVSSGTKEMIEGTTIKKEFKRIYASSFKFDQHDIPEWPAISINYTTKTQYLFRINKGIDSAWNNDGINDYMLENERPMPFKHMIYIGDGTTDIPSMKLVYHQGGTSIGVYARDGAKKADTMALLEQKRITYAARADYSEGEELDKILKAVIDRISATESIKRYSNFQSNSKSK